MSYDAKKAAYQEVTILGRPALFAECRIDNSTVPKGLYRYELRHGDENWGDPVRQNMNQRMLQDKGNAAPFYAKAAFSYYEKGG